MEKHTLDDIVFFYTEKKRLTNKNFKYIDTPSNQNYMKLGAVLCEELKLHPGVFVQTIYDNMGDAKAFFSPKHLQGKNVKKLFESKDNGLDSYRVEITNATLEYEDIWKYQHELAMLYIKNGEAPESVLLDSSLKFFAWFRILATPDKYPAIIKKYKHIAKKEMNPRLLAFAKAEGLDIERILD